MGKLSSEQSKKLADNIKLIPFTIKKTFGKGFKEKYYEEAYDAALEGLLRSATKWTPAISEFNTLAVFAIRRELIKWWQRKTSKQKKYPTVNSAFGAGEDDYDNNSQVDFPSRPENLFATVAATTISNLLPKLEDKYRNLLELLYGLNGKTKTRKKDVAILMNTSVAMVAYFRNKAIKKLQSIAKKEGITVG